jgi:hypothetical protein
MPSPTDGTFSRDPTDVRPRGERRIAIDLLQHFWTIQDIQDLSIGKLAVSTTSSIRKQQLEL